MAFNQLANEAGVITTDRIELFFSTTKAQEQQETGYVDPIWEEMRKEFDKDDSGSISKEEFMDGMRALAG